MDRTEPRKTLDEHDELTSRSHAGLRPGIHRHPSRTPKQIDGLSLRTVPRSLSAVTGTSRLLTPMQGLAFPLRRFPVWERVRSNCDKYYRKFQRAYMLLWCYIS